jgi:hypothetical protein
MSKNQEMARSIEVLNAMTNPAFDWPTLNEWAGKWRKSPRTVRNWRAKGAGPRLTYIGRTPHVSPEAEAEWLRAREEQPAKAEPRQRRRRNGR